MKAFSYLAKQYLKSFLIVAFGLTFAATLIDFIQYVDKIDGVNRRFLYFYYTFSDYFLFIYPIAFVFGAIITFSNLIWKNHLVAFSSFGYDKNRLIKPFLAVFLIIYLTLFTLNFTSFAYSGDSARAILDKRELFKSLNNIFFKYDNNFVFAKEMDVVNKEFKDVTLYIVKNGRLSNLLHFDKAKFKNGKWIAYNIEKKVIKYKDSKPQGYKIFKIAKEEVLQGYYPKVVRLLYEGKRMSIDDGFRALALLNQQGIDNSKVKSALYTKIVMPLFAPFLIMIIFALLPMHKRFLSRAKFLAFTMGSTLIVWTILYSVNMLGVNGVIQVDFGQPVVVLILAIISIISWIKRKERF